MGMFSMRMSSALRIAQGWSVDADGVAVMPDTAQERFDHIAIAEEVGPFVISKLRCNDRRLSAITLLHEFEEDVGLFGFQI